MSDTTTRVFHPTLRESYDILNTEVDSWKDSGWLLEEPDYDALQGITPAAPVDEPKSRGQKAADDKPQQ